MMASILIVEDDPTLAFALAGHCRGAGYEVRRADSLRAAEQALAAALPDLLLLDLNLPDGHGVRLLETLRKRSALPVIILSVLDDEAEILAGFAAGADDYVTKPFSAAILLARIRAALGESKSARALYHDEAKTAILANGVPLALTPTEYRLLARLMAHWGQTVTRERLLARLWDDDGHYVEDNTLSQTVRRLREKLGDHATISTVRGIGYRLEDKP